jgi:hypothetical protein
MASRGGLLFFVLFMACGGDSDPPPFEPGRQVNTLSQPEVATLCDWVADKFGGYGKTIHCSDSSTRSSRESQADCVDSLAGASCQATVGDVEVCTNESLRCGSLASLLSNASCQRLIGCSK